MSDRKQVSYSVTLPECHALPLQWNYNNEYVSIDSPTTYAHIHPFYEMYVYVSGDISFVTNNRIFDLSPGDIIFTGPNTMHHSIVNSNCLHKHYCIFFYSVTDVVAPVFTLLAEKKYLHFFEEQQRMFIELLEKMNEYFVNPECDPFRRISSMYEMFSLLQSAVGCENPPQYPPILQNILTYIGTYYANLHSLSAIRDHFYISQSSLERLFKKYLQITPYQYINAVKMEHACQFLGEGLSVMEAAMKSGFSDVSHFIADFRRRFEMTPNQYRKLLEQVLVNRSAN